MKITKNLFYNNQKGFTLIELLIVIAILGVLAAVLIALINPADQIARSRDSGRKAAGAQLYRAMQAYNLAQNSIPTANGSWITTIVSEGEFKSAPSSITYASGSKNPTACLVATSNNQNGYCYVQGTTATDYAIFVRMESGAEWGKCQGTIGGQNSGRNAYWLYSSKDVKSGIVCMAGDPTGDHVSHLTDPSQFGATAAGTYLP